MDSITHKKEMQGMIHLTNDTTKTYRDRLKAEEQRKRLEEYRKYRKTKDTANEPPLTQDDFNKLTEALKG